MPTILNPPTMRTWLLLLVCSLVLTLGAAAHAQQPAPVTAPAPAAAPATADAGAPAAAAATPPPQDQRLADAKAHFLRGVEHTTRGEWDAALVEFLRSREIMPTSKATYNAAVSLRKVNRFDEALDMYEALLREFPNIGQQEKDIAVNELAQLKGSIGVIELRGGVKAAKISIDGRDRGTYPPALPLRVGAGNHAVRVSAEGYLPFEARVDVAGGQTVPVNVQLVALTAGGRLRVAEQTGKALDVLVDNAVVGKTPWEGLLAPGDHVVLLRGEQNLGTQPVVASVKLNLLVSLNLLAEQLDASIRIQPTPGSAMVSIDAIPVGLGTWEGRLRLGPHAIEATADGYLPFKRDVDLKKDATESVVATLERDPNVFAGSAALGLEIDAALPIGALFGGDLSDGCSGGCSAGMPLGMHGVLHGIYETASGFGGGVDVGYLLTNRTLTAREASVQPIQGSAPNLGKANDKLRLGGLTVGASAQYHRGQEWPVLVRIGVGALLASTADERSGTFTNSKNEAYTVSRRETPSGTYLYVAPELRLGRKFGKHFEVNAGFEILVMTALSQPKWADKSQFLTGNAGAQGDGLGKFGDQSIAGSFMLFVAPGLGARYDF